MTATESLFDQCLNPLLQQNRPKADDQPTVGLVPFASTLPMWSGELQEAMAKRGPELRRQSGDGLALGNVAEVRDEHVARP